MVRIYKTAPPALLMLLGWLLVAAAMAWRVRQGMDIPPINGLFILVGLGAYFLPTRVAEYASGETLSRKLLWILLLAGILIIPADFLLTSFLGNQRLCFFPLLPYIISIPD